VFLQSSGDVSAKAGGVHIVVTYLFMLLAFSDLRCVHTRFGGLGRMPLLVLFHRYCCVMGAQA